MELFLLHNGDELLGARLSLQAANEAALPYAREMIASDDENADTPPESITVRYDEQKSRIDILIDGAFYHSIAVSTLDTDESL